MSDIEVRYARVDGLEEFDEIVATNATVHLEKMNRAEFYLGIETPTESAKFSIIAFPTGLVDGIHGARINAFEYERSPQPAPIRLNDQQVALAQTWAADDRLWNTQDAVALNLQTFARAVLLAG